jgi:hypothetical protein
VPDGRVHGKRRPLLLLQRRRGVHLRGDQQHLFGAHQWHLLLREQRWWRWRQWWRKRRSLRGAWLGVLQLQRGLLPAGHPRLQGCVLRRFEPRKECCLPSRSMQLFLHGLSELGGKAETRRPSGAGGGAGGLLVRTRTRTVRFPRPPCFSRAGRCTLTRPRELRRNRRSSVRFVPAAWRGEAVAPHTTESAWSRSSTAPFETISPRPEVSGKRSPTSSLAR